MNLTIHELIHFLPAFPIAYFVWKKYSNFIISFLAAFLGSIIIDIDHVTDYFFAFGMNLKISNFLKGLQFLKSGKMYVFFHSWELIILLSTITLLTFFLKKTKFFRLKAFLLAFSLSLFFHLMIDVWINNIPVKSYFLIYRIRNNFDLKLLKR